MNPIRNYAPICTKVLIMTPTMYYVGDVYQETEKDITLCRYSWVVETGPLAEALKTGEFKKAEEMPGIVIIGRSAYIAIHSVGEINDI